MEKVKVEYQRGEFKGVFWLTKSEVEHYYFKILLFGSVLKKEDSKVDENPWASFMKKAKEDALELNKIIKQIGIR